MISIKEVEHLHHILIDTFGGAHGIRNFESLQSALARPFQTFDNTELYPSPIEKAASLLESILINHPFLDGNKRTGYTIMRLLLIQNGLDVTASQNEKYQFIIGVASGIIKYNDIVTWLKSNVTEKSSG